MLRKFLFPRLRRFGRYRQRTRGTTPAANCSTVSCRRGAVCSVREAPPPPGAAVLYMRTCRRRRRPLTRAPETRHKPRHVPPVAPPACTWRGLSRVSRARVPLYRRRRELRGRAGDPQSVILAVWGGGYHGYFPHFATFRVPNAHAAIAVSTWATYGHKIFFTQPAVSSRALSTEVA